MRALLILLVGLPFSVHAQRADDNAVKSADDAFGTSVGNETIGLYQPFEVRGFSAVDAGNVRLDGLYFDRQTDPITLLVPSSTMRVGISAQGYLLPAPTGIVDYQLARAGDQLRISPVVGYGPFDSLFVDLEAELPLVAGQFGIAGGLSYFEDAFEAGNDERGWSVAVAPRWRPSESIEIIPFYSRTTIEDNEAQPLVFVAGAYLPPEVKRDYFYGQTWADNEDVGENYGAVANVGFGQDWTVNAGIFRSQFQADASFADLFLNTSPDGFADHVMIADRDQKFASTSGEVRVSKRFVRGKRYHAFYYSLRARDQQRRYGGSDAADLGVARIGQRANLPQPQFEFGPQTHDEVTQWTNAVAYRGRWSDLVEITLGLQKTRYEKEVTEPGALTPQLGKDDPWLYNAGLALYANDRLAWYASYSTGLEEGGVAPENASNKSSAPPAIRTRQWDAGMRYAFTPALKLVVGVFDIQKPYYGLDDANLFRELGEQRHRGVELSLAGEVVDGLNVVIGTVLIEPRVSGDEVSNGTIGKVPVGQTERLTIGSVEYRLPWVPSFSLSATLTSVDDRMASSDNRLSIPARTRARPGRALSIPDRPRTGHAALHLRQRVRQVRLAHQYVGSVRDERTTPLRRDARRGFSRRALADLERERPRRPGVTRPGGTGGDRYGQVHFGAQHHRVALAALRGLDLELSVGEHIDIHEEIECGRQAVRLDAEVTQCRPEIVMAVRVVAGHTILHAIHFEAARCVEKIVAADVVRDDREQRVAAVGPEYITDREQDLAVVIERASVRQALASVLRERHEVAGLTPFDVDEAQMLAARESQPGAAAWSNDVLRSHSAMVRERQSFHLMLQPRLGFWVDDTAAPFSRASHAARRSFPLGMPRPGRLSSNWPR